MATASMSSTDLAQTSPHLSIVILQSCMLIKARPLRKNSADRPEQIEQKLLVLIAFILSKQMDCVFDENCCSSSLPLIILASSFKSLSMVRRAPLLILKTLPFFLSPPATDLLVCRP